MLFTGNLKQPLSSSLSVHELATLSECPLRADLHLRSSNTQLQGAKAPWILSRMSPWPDIRRFWTRRDLGSCLSHVPIMKSVRRDALFRCIVDATPRALAELLQSPRSANSSDSTVLVHMCELYGRGSLGLRPFRPDDQCLPIYLGSCVAPPKLAWMVAGAPPTIHQSFTNLTRPDVPWFVCWTRF